MTPVKTLPKFKCDFCNRRSIKKSMERHENICYYNPNRVCPTCDGKGYWYECYGDLIEEGDCGLSERFECPACEIAEKIKKGELVVQELKAKEITKVPF